MTTYKIRTDGKIPEKALSIAKTRLGSRGEKEIFDNCVAQMEESLVLWRENHPSWWKRFSAEHKKLYGLFPDPYGSLANASSVVSSYGVSNEIESMVIDQVFDWKPGDFGDRNSCYWGPYSSLRDIVMPQSGFLSARVFDSQGDGVARCWLAPDGKWLGAFNFYGLSQNQFFNIFTQIGYVVTEIRFRQEPSTGDGREDFYINSEFNLVLGPKEWKGSEFKMKYTPALYPCELTGDLVRNEELMRVMTSREMAIFVSRERAQEAGIVVTKYGSVLFSRDAVAVYNNDFSFLDWHSAWDVKDEVEKGSIGKKDGKYYFL